jgi:phospholipase/carboxylesterase
MTHNGKVTIDHDHPLTSISADTPRPTGMRPLGLEKRRDGLLYVPPGYSAAHPGPLAVAFHGAGSDAERGLAPLLPLADETNTILIALDSRERTWDAIRGDYGPDVAFLDRALTQFFVRYAVDRTRIAATGFSDGASYALGVGLMNSDLFTHIIAFSPGFIPPVRAERCVPMFISHGTQDSVLPIERCSRRIVDQVRQAGCEVDYREFDGPHTVPPKIAREAMAWFVGEQG